MRNYPFRVQFVPTEHVWYVHCGDATNLPMYTTSFRDRKELAVFLKDLKEMFENV